MMADQNGMKGIYETYDPLTGKYKNEYSTGGYCTFQFGWSSAFTMEMILKRYQEERFIFEDSYQLKGFIRRAEDFSSREVFYQIDAGLGLPYLELESGDGLPLPEAKKLRIRLSDPYQVLSSGKFRVQLKHKSFELELGKEYLLSLD